MPPKQARNLYRTEEQEERAQRKRLRTGWRSGASEESKARAIRLATSRLPGARRYSWLDQDTVSIAQAPGKSRAIGLGITDRDITAELGISGSPASNTDIRQLEPTKMAQKIPGEATLSAAEAEAVLIDMSRNPKSANGGEASTEQLLAVLMYQIANEPKKAQECQPAVETSKTEVIEGGPLSVDDMEEMLTEWSTPNTPSEPEVETPDQLTVEEMEAMLGEMAEENSPQDQPEAAPEQLTVDEMEAILGEMAEENPPSSQPEAELDQSTVDEMEAMLMEMSEANTPPLQETVTANQSQSTSEAGYCRPDPITKSDGVTMSEPTKRRSANASHESTPLSRKRQRTDDGVRTLDKSTSNVLVDVVSVANSRAASDNFSDHPRGQTEAIDTTVIDLTEKTLSSEKDNNNHKISGGGLTLPQLSFPSHLALPPPSAAIRTAQASIIRHSAPSDPIPSAPSTAHVLETESIPTSLDFLFGPDARDNRASAAQRKEVLALPPSVTQAKESFLRTEPSASKSRKRQSASKKVSRTPCLAHGGIVPRTVRHTTHRPPAMADLSGSTGSSPRAQQDFPPSYSISPLQGSPNALKYSSASMMQGNMATANYRPTRHFSIPSGQNSLQSVPVNYHDNTLPTPCSLPTQASNITSGVRATDGNSNHLQLGGDPVQSFPVNYRNSSLRRHYNTPLQTPYGTLSARTTITSASNVAGGQIAVHPFPVNYHNGSLAMDYDLRPQTPHSSPGSRANSIIPSQYAPGYEYQATDTNLRFNNGMSHYSPPLVNSNSMSNIQHGGTYSWPTAFPLAQNPHLAKTQQLSTNSTNYPPPSQYHQQTYLGEPALFEAVQDLQSLRNRQGR